MYNINNEIGSTYISDSIRKICWREEWAHPYESVLSIIAKVKISNCINSQEIIRLFGNINIREQKTCTTAARYMNLYSMYGFDRELLMNYTTFDLTQQRKLIRNICNSGIKTNIKYHFSRYLKYCDECMKYYFHSIFHQLLNTYKCPFHEVELRDACINCGKSTLYSFKYGDFYKCSCGFNISGNSGCSWNIWNEIFEIKRDVLIGEFLDI